MNYVKVIQELGRPVAYYPLLSKAFGSNNVGIFLSQMMYWEGKQADKNGWIMKPQKQITEETGLSRHESDTVRKKLRSLKVLDEEKRGTPARLFMKFDWDVANEIVHNFVNKVEVPKIKKVPTILGEMKDVFDEEYKLNEFTQELETYSWTEKDWRHLKNLKETFEKRIDDRVFNKKMEQPTDMNKSIVDAWSLFLKNMPEFYRKNQFYPSGLYSNFSAILQTIINENKKINGSKKTRGFADAAKARA